MARSFVASCPTVAEREVAGRGAGVAKLSTARGLASSIGVSCDAIEDGVRLFALTPATGFLGRCDTVTTRSAVISASVPPVAAAQATRRLAPSERRKDHEGAEVASGRLRSSSGSWARMPPSAAAGGDKFSPDADTSPSAPEVGAAAGGTASTAAMGTSDGRGPRTTRARFLVAPASLCRTHCATSRVNG